MQTDATAGCKVKIDTLAASRTQFSACLAIIGSSLTGTIHTCTRLLLAARRSPLADAISRTCGRTVRLEDLPPLCVSRRNAAAETAR
ncbi:MAG TPA: hypothetical protein VF774_17970 [Pseudoduganella sp.]|jgi:hypothetical protein